MSDFIFLDNSRTLGFERRTPGRSGRGKRRTIQRWMLLPPRYLTWRVDWRRWLSSAHRRRQQRIADLWEY